MANGSNPEWLYQLLRQLGIDEEFITQPNKRGLTDQYGNILTKQQASLGDAGKLQNLPQSMRDSLLSLLGIAGETATETGNILQDAGLEVSNSAKYTPPTPTPGAGKDSIMRPPAPPDPTPMPTPTIPGEDWLSKLTGRTLSVENPATLYEQNRWQANTAHEQYQTQLKEHRKKEEEKFRRNIQDATDADRAMLNSARYGSNPNTRATYVNRALDDLRRERKKAGTGLQEY